MLMNILKYFGIGVKNVRTTNDIKEITIKVAGKTIRRSVDKLQDKIQTHGHIRKRVELR